MSRYDAPINISMALIKIYYHIADLVGWQELVDEKINLMKKSGLWESADEIHLLLHYDFVFFQDWIQQFNDDKKVKIVHFKNSFRPLGESYSNRYIWNDCWNSEEDFFLFRFHTKGLVQRFLPHWPIAHDWNKYYDYFNIEKWNDCVRSLEEGYDLAGVNWHFPGHFSGNIWWARSSFVKSLPLPTAPHLINAARQISISLSPRHDAELWIGLQPGKVKEFHHHADVCIYSVLPPMDYRDN